MSHDEEYMHEREQFFTEPIEVVVPPKFVTVSEALLEDYKLMAITQTLQSMTFDEWLDLGLAKGFTGPPVCSTHDGIPMNLDEEHEFETGGDPCVFVMRPYDSAEERFEVEKNHGASVWRRNGRE